MDQVAPTCQGNRRQTALGNGPPIGRTPLCYYFKYYDTKVARCCGTLLFEELAYFALVAIAKRVWSVPAKSSKDL